MTNESEIEDKVGKDLANLLKCNICWEFFHEPTILPCGHTFCYTCLQEIGRHTIKNHKTILNNAQITINIYCPNCRLAVPYSDVEEKKNGVRFNFALNSIKDHVKESKSPEKVDASTNTETNALEDARLDEMEASLDSTFRAVRMKGSVLHDARDAIDVIRNNMAMKTSKGEDELLTNSDWYPERSSMASPLKSFIMPSAAISHGAWAKWQRTQDTPVTVNILKRSPSSIKGENIVYKAVPLSPSAILSHSKMNGRSTTTLQNDPANLDPAIVSVVGPLQS